LLVWDELLGRTKSIREAADTYRDDPVALKGMNLGTVLGARAYTAGSDVQE
jgi:hypothetical protein